MDTDWEDSDPEDLDEAYESYEAVASRHPLLDADIQEVRTFSDSAVSVREFSSIDGVSVSLNIYASLKESVAQAWRVNPSEVIVVCLYFSLSQYLDGPAPSVKVYQPSNEFFGIGHQLQSILGLYISEEWKHISNEKLVQKKERLSWCSASSLTAARPNGLQQRAVKIRAISPAMKQNNLIGCTTAITVEHPEEEHLTYTPSGKTEASAQQCGFLMQIIRYTEQRILTLNEHCVVCDEKHLFQNACMLKPAVCTRELCVYSFYNLGVMKGATEDVATGAEIVDLLVAMCRAALLSSRRAIIFNPYPSVVDPHNCKVLAFSPNNKNYDKLQEVLANVLMVTRMPQGSYEAMKQQMDVVDPLAHPLLQWIVDSNRSYIVKLPQHKQLKFMDTPHQFLLISSSPSKEASFTDAKKIHGSTFAFHGSHIENWHSILRHGLLNASGTKFQLHGAAYGHGIYLSPMSSISFGYSGQYKISSKDGATKHQKQPESGRFLKSTNLSCIALCEVITSTELQKHHQIWKNPTPDHVCTRFLFVYENGRVGSFNINTQDRRIEKEILQVIAANPHC
ncbi:protein mono-ADP-ribosyltransferase PARP6-like [Genypterus blacodes]|uniref:protein mono-ADP-ribosyltransferase PARP6-like n=1 Tax=Genypterus blacodes TaxID=154954 RepID=UPI003F760C0D